MTGRRTVAVAGTHGKTTTTSMVTAILQHAGQDPSFVIGGEISEVGSNAHHGSGEHFVVEADESDRSFLLYRPYVAIVTNIDADHLNTYGDLDGLKDGLPGVQPADRAGRLPGDLRRRRGRPVAGAAGPRGRRDRLHLRRGGRRRPADDRDRLVRERRALPGLVRGRGRWARSPCGYRGGTSGLNSRGRGAHHAEAGRAARVHCGGSGRRSRACGAGSSSRAPSTGCGSTTSTPTTRRR